MNQAFALNFDVFIQSNPHISGCPETLLTDHHQMHLPTPNASPRQIGIFLSFLLCINQKLILKININIEDISGPAISLN